MPKFYRQNKKKINPRYFLNETRLDEMKKVISGAFRDAVEAAMFDILYMYGPTQSEKHTLKKGDYLHNFQSTWQGTLTQFNNNLFYEKPTSRVSGFDFSSLMPDGNVPDSVVQDDLMQGYEWPAPEGKASDAWLRSRMKKNDGKLPFTEYVLYIMEDLGYIAGNGQFKNPKWRLKNAGAKKIIDLERRAIEAGKGYLQKTYGGYKGPDNPDEHPRPDDYGLAGEREVEDREERYKASSKKFDPSRWEKFKDELEDEEDI